MDQQTFEELIKDGEIALILMDGGADLSKEQMNRVKEVAKQQSREKLLQMSIELALSPGYRDFITLPLVSTIMSGRRKPVSPADVDKQEDTAVGDESTGKTAGKKRTKKSKAKDPETSSVSPGTSRPLRFGDGEGDILGKIYNFLRNERKVYDERAEDTKKFQKLVDHTKEQDVEELISLFTGKKFKRKGFEEKEKVEPVKKKTGIGKILTVAGIIATLSALIAPSVQAAIRRTSPEMEGDGDLLSKSKFNQLTKDQQNALLKTQEHWEGADKAGTLSNRMNNPGSILIPKGSQIPDYAKQLGATLGEENKDGVLLKFPTMEAGRAAQRKLWEKKGDMPLSQALKSWAPDASSEYTNAILDAVRKAGPIPSMLGFQSPIEGGKVTGHVGEAREGHTHAGVDIAAALGTAVKASTGGTVRTGFQAGGAGNYVVVTDKDGNVTKYFHLQDVGVKEGEEVKAGQQIGTVGSTGHSTGPHLHFEAYSGGKLIDAEQIFKQTSIPTMASSGGQSSGGNNVIINSINNVLNGPKVYEASQEIAEDVMSTNFFR